MANTNKTIGAACLEKYPGNVPVIVHYKNVVFTDLKSKEAIKHRSNFMIPKNMTVADLILVVRVKSSIQATDALFVFINNSLPCITDTISNIYDRHKNPVDDCLHIVITKENTFG